VDRVPVVRGVRPYRPDIDRVGPVGTVVVPEPDRDHADDAVPLVGAAILDDPLGDQARPDVLDDDPRAVAADPLGIGLRARAARRRTRSADAVPPGVPAWLPWPRS